MAWLHTWAGLLPGWVLFLIFMFGTTAFFHLEINRWMRPEARVAPVSARALDAAGALLATRAAGADGWTLSFEGAERGDGFYVSWLPKGVTPSQREQATLDPITGEPVTIRETQGGTFLYLFHYNLYYMPALWARYIVIAASLAMLVAILSGVVTHKKMFADFFTLRFGKGQRSWLDAHNVAGVLALPFHLMITYTGLVTLMFVAMPWAISAAYPVRDAFFDAVAPHPHVEASGRSAPLLPLSDLVARATRVGVDFVPGYIVVEHPGDANAVVEILPQRDRLPSPHGAVHLNGVTGEVLQAPQAQGPAIATNGVMIDLHAARFADPVLRWLYFLAGAGGTAMIASGLVLWTVKRRAKLSDPDRPHIGFKLVGRLNIGVVAGATAAIAVYFLANRLLPIGMAHRADWEINSLFIAWGALFVWSIGRPAKRAWIETLAAGALLYALVPVVNACTTERGLIPSLIARDWIFVGFDLTVLVMAAALAFAAGKVAARKPNAAAERRTCASVEAIL